MRVELIAIKAAIEVAMSHDIELDADVPEELVDHMAALHSGIDRLENPEKYEDKMSRAPDEAPVDGEPEGADDLAMGLC